MRSLLWVDPALSESQAESVVSGTRQATPWPCQENYLHGPCLVWELFRWSKQARHGRQCVPNLRDLLNHAGPSVGYLLTRLARLGNPVCIYRLVKCFFAEPMFTCLPWVLNTGSLLLREVGLFMASTIRRPTSSFAARKGSSTRWAYLWVVAAWVWPNRAPIIGRPSPAAAPNEA